jgi:hypothetical protein
MLWLSPALWRECFSLVSRDVLPFVSRTPKAREPTSSFLIIKRPQSHAGEGTTPALRMLVVEWFPMLTSPKKARWICVVFMLFSTGCSRTLSRNAAASQIRAALLASSNARMDCRIYPVSDGAFGNYPPLNNDAKAMKCLQLMFGSQTWKGLYNLQWARPKVVETPQYGEGRWQCQLEWTDEGKKITPNWRRDKNGWWLVPMATRELVQVTGIQQVEQFGEAQVEYKWRWSPVKVSKDYIARLCPSLDTKIDVEHATFTKFDDGWRLKSVSLNW